MSSATETFNNINILPGVLRENNSDFPNQHEEIITLSDGKTITLRLFNIGAGRNKIIIDKLVEKINEMVTKFDTMKLIMPPEVSTGYSAPCYRIYCVDLDETNTIAAVFYYAFIGDNPMSSEIEKLSTLSYMGFNDKSNYLFDGHPLPPVSSGISDLVEDVPINEELLESTFIHEFLHSIQTGSYFFRDRENATWNNQMLWLLESTAEFITTYDFANNQYAITARSIYDSPIKRDYFIKLFKERKYDYFLTTKHYGAFLMIKYFSEKSTLYSAIKDENGIIDPDIIVDPDDLLFMQTIFGLINAEFVKSDTYVPNYEKPYDDEINNLTVTELIGRTIREIQNPDASNKEKIEMVTKSNIQLFDEYYGNFYKTSMVLFAFFELAPGYNVSVGNDLSFNVLTSSLGSNSIYVFEEYKNYIDMFDGYDDDDNIYEMWNNNVDNMIDSLIVDTEGFSSRFLYDVSGNYGADLFIVDTSTILGENEEGSITKKTQHIDININMLKGSIDNGGVSKEIPGQQTDDELAALFAKMDFYTPMHNPTKKMYRGSGRGILASVRRSVISKFVM